MTASAAAGAVSSASAGFSAALLTFLVYQHAAAALWAAFGKAVAFKDAAAAGAFIDMFLIV